MLGIPAPTPYDLRFRLLGIPVRVHPLFWIVSAVLGWSQSVAAVLVWVGCVFVSILVHEYGHGLTARVFGYPAGIVLYGMGGLCASDGERQSPSERLGVLAAGPGAGFALFALIVTGLFLLYRVTPAESVSLLLSSVGLGLPSMSAIGKLRPLGVHGIYAVYALMYINVFWGLVNLLPIWPLDGGQIAGVVLGWANPRHGRRWTHVVSLLTAGVLALVSYMRFESLFGAIFFGLFAAMNYQLLQVLHAQARYGSFEGDDDWWRR
jgi:Zn-dependent protease